LVDTPNRKKTRGSRRDKKRFPAGGEPVSKQFREDSGPSTKKNAKKKRRVRGGYKGKFPESQTLKIFKRGNPQKNTLGKKCHGRGTKRVDYLAKKTAMGKLDK